MLRPAREQAEDVAEVRPRLDAAQLTASEERREDAFTAPPSSLPREIEFLRPCGPLHSRKNYLFVHDVERGASIAGLYSLVATCEARGINPFEYLADVLARVQDYPGTQDSTSYSPAPGPLRPTTSEPLTRTTSRRCVGQCRRTVAPQTFPVALSECEGYALALTIARTADQRRPCAPLSLPIVSTRKSVKVCAEKFVQDTKKSATFSSDSTSCAVVITMRSATSASDAFNVIITKASSAASSQAKGSSPPHTKYRHPASISATTKRCRCSTVRSPPESPEWAGEASAVERHGEWERIELLQ